VTHSTPFARRTRPRRMPIRTDRRRFHKDPWDGDEFEIDIGCPIDEDEGKRDDRG
jgi:hypothetical protein